MIYYHSLLSTSIIISGFDSSTSLGWHLWSLNIWETSLQDFRITIKMSSISMLVLLLYVTWSFSVSAFSLSFLFRIIFLIIMCPKEFPLWSSLCGVWCAYCILRDISFLRLMKCSMILRKVSGNGFIFYFQCSYICFFHGIPDILSALCLDFFRYKIFFNLGIYVFYFVTNDWHSSLMPLLGCLILKVFV